MGFLYVEKKNGYITLLMNSFFMVRDKDCNLLITNQFEIAYALCCYPMSTLALVV